MLNSLTASSHKCQNCIRYFAAATNC